MLSILDSVPWQMVAGERAALEGLLCQVKPKLAVEVGTADGGSLRVIARHSARVHSFDLVPPPADVSDLPNVTVHTGDSHVLLPQVLSDLAREGHNVDFVLVDGDHTADGTERDARDLLASDAVRSTVILFHDTMNEEVREGLTRIDAATEPKITYYDLDFVGGRLTYGEKFPHQLWGGFGIMVVDASSAARKSSAAPARDAYPFFEVVAPVRDALVAQEQRGAATGPGTVRDALLAASASHHELSELHAQVADLHRRLGEVVNSKSWRLTAPLRTAAARVRDARR